MNTLLAIGIFQGVFLALLLFAKKQKSVSDYLLALFCLLTSITTFISLMEIYNRQNNYPYPMFLHLSAPFLFLHGPTIGLYVLSLTTQNFKFKTNHLLHLLPFILIFGLFVVGILSQPAEARIELDIQQSFKENWMYPFTVAGVFISTHAYLISGLWLLRQYRKRIKQYFSNVEPINLSWLHFLIYTAIVAYGINSLTYIIDYFHGLMPYGTMQLLAYIIGTIFIMMLGFFGLMHENIFTSNRKPDIDLEKSNTIRFDEALVSDGEEAFIHSLLQYMKTAKPHLNPELTIAILSEDLKVTPEYLSNILNGRLNMNFFDFVNHHRINEFKERCKIPESKNFTLMGLAMECGFNSKATFNRVFKNSTKLTPGEYVKEVSKK